MTKRDFHNIIRRNASGTFVDEVPDEFPDGYANRLELADGPPTSPAAFPAGVYTLDDRSILVVAEPMTFLQHAALLASETPSWANAIIGATVLTDSNEPLRIEVDTVQPSNVDHAAAAFAAACASYDDALHSANPVDGMVRISGSILRVRAALSDRAWSGTVESASEAERSEMSQWRFYRSLAPAGREHGVSWCVFDGTTFRRVAHVRELAGMMQFGVIAIDGRSIAIFTMPTTPDQRARIASASRPEWIDVVVIANLVTGSANPHARVEVGLIDPMGSSSSSIAAACTVEYRLQGRFDVVLESCTVVIAGEQIQCTLGENADANPSRVSFWVRTRPLP